MNHPYDVTIVESMFYTQFAIITLQCYLVVKLSWEF